MLLSTTSRQLSVHDVQTRSGAMNVLDNRSAHFQAGAFRVYPPLATHFYYCRRIAGRSTNIRWTASADSGSTVRQSEDSMTNFHRNFHRASLDVTEQVKNSIASPKGQAFGSDSLRGLSTNNALPSGRERRLRHVFLITTWHISVTLIP